MKNKCRHLFVPLLFACACISVTLSIGKWKNPGYWEFDVGGYYSLLPSIFIYQDLFTMEGYLKMEQQHVPAQNKYGYYQSPETGKWVNKYPVGVALMQTPFYLAAHFLSLNIPSETYDGYSPVFLLLMMIATIFYSCCGLWYLSRFLNKYFPLKVVVTTLLLVAFGTNLFLYNANLPGLSHPYLFFLLSALLFYSGAWYRSPTFRLSFVIGLLIGMCVITRPTAALVLVIPLLLLVSKMRASHLYRPMVHLALSTIGFFLVASIQMLYWKSASGHWIFYSYVEEGFDFLRPHIIDGLFSYRKGWFVYTPVALAAVIGMVLMRRHDLLKVYFYPVLFYFALVIYVVFSWTQWSYGGGFGARAMIDSYGVLALPLCVLVDRLFRLRRQWLMGAFMAASVFLVSLNLFQTFQFQVGIIPWDGINQKYYWAIFGDVERSEEKVKLMDEGE